MIGRLGIDGSASGGVSDTVPAMRGEGSGLRGRRRGHEVDVRRVFGLETEVRASVRVRFRGGEDPGLVGAPGRPTRVVEGGGRKVEGEGRGVGEESEGVGKVGAGL